jgi:hypothetical protein
MNFVVDYWPVFLSLVAVIVWGARLEAKAATLTSTTVKREEHATQVQALKDVKESVGRIERKVDRLLER